MINISIYGKDPFYTKLIDRAIKHYPKVTIEKQDEVTWVFKYQNKLKSYSSEAGTRVRLLKLKKLSHKIKFLLGKIGLFKEYRAKFKETIKRLSELQGQPKISDEPKLSDIEVLLNQSSEELISKLTHEKDKLQGRLTRVKNKLDCLVSQQDDALREIKRNEESIETEQQRQNELVMELTRLNEQHLALDEAKTKICHYYEKKRNQNWFTASDKKHELNTIRDELSKILNATLNNQEEDLAILDEKMALLNEAIEILKKSIEASCSNIHRYTAKKEDLGAKVAIFEKRIGGKKAKEQELKQHLEEIAEGMGELLEDEADPSEKSEASGDVVESEVSLFESPEVDLDQDPEPVNSINEEEFLKRITLPNLLNKQTIPNFIVNPSEVAAVVLKSLVQRPSLIRKLAQYLKVKPATMTTKIEGLNVVWNNESAWNELDTDERRSLQIQQALDKLHQDPLFHRYAVLPLPGIIGFLKKIEPKEILERTPEQILNILLSRKEPSSPFEQHIKNYLGPWCDEAFKNVIDDAFSVEPPSVKEKEVLEKALFAAKFFIKMPGKKLIVRKFLLSSLEKSLAGYLNTQRNAASLSSLKTDSLWFAQISYNRFFDQRSIDVFVKLAIKVLALDLFSIESILELQKQAGALERLQKQRVSEVEVQKKIREIKNLKEHLKEKANQRTEEILYALIHIVQDQLRILLNTPFENECIEGLLRHVRSFQWDTSHLDLLSQVWRGLILPFLLELIEESESK